jgi:coenzyme F420-reducing hydrogenase delta subunit
MACLYRVATLVIVTILRATSSRDVVLRSYDRERLRMTMISASEGAIWAEVVQDMVNTIKKLGPNPLKQAVAAGAAGQEGVAADDEF